MRPADTSLASRAPCGPEKLKSSREAMPFSKMSRCSGSASTDCTMCRSMHALRIELHQRLGQEVGLLLVVALEADAVAGFEHGFEQRGDGFGGHDLAHPLRAERLRDPGQSRRAVGGLGVPVHAVHL